jgi:hypothetical protein
VDIFILPEDIRHRGHIHCVSGIKKFCQRTGVDYERLMNGSMSTDELRSFDTAMGNEVARNAEERVAMIPKQEDNKDGECTQEVSK